MATRGGPPMSRHPRPDRWLDDEKRQFDTNGSGPVFKSIGFFFPRWAFSLHFMVP
jgi:hypothetical protein